MSTYVLPDFTRGPPLHEKIKYLIEALTIAAGVSRSAGLDIDAAVAGLQSAVDEVYMSSDEYAAVNGNVWQAGDTEYWPSRPDISGAFDAAKLSHGVTGICIEPSCASPSDDITDCPYMLVCIEVAVDVAKCVRFFAPDTSDETIDEVVAALLDLATAAASLIHVTAPVTVREVVDSMVASIKSIKSDMD